MASLRPVCQHMLATLAGNLSVVLVRHSMMDAPPEFSEENLACANQADAAVAIADTP